MKSIEEILYDEIDDAVAQQQSIVDNVRNRAGVVFTGSAVATAFLVSQSAGCEIGPRVRFAALALFALGAFLAASVMLPINYGLTSWRVLTLFGFVGQNEPRWIFGVTAEARENGKYAKTVEELLTIFTRDLERVYARNNIKISHLVNVTRLAALLLACEVGLWVLVLVRGRC